MTIDDARALVADTALWPRVRDFLWDFAPQIHASWLDGLGLETTGTSREAGFDASQFAGLMSSPRVKRFVLKSLGVSACFHPFPKEDHSRLLLLDGPTLEAIAKWLGAIASVDALRRVTDGATVRGLKASLPGIYPDVFGFTAYFKGLEILCAENSHENVASTGASILASLIAPLPEPLSSRLKFKLPKGLCDGCALRGEKEMSAAGAAVKKLLKLKFPEAYKLCC